MTDANASSPGLPAEGYAARGPRIVAMDDRGTKNQEAYYLFFVASVGMALNLLVIVTTFIRRNLRKMTSAFLIHASVLNLMKAAFCIVFGVNLLDSAGLEPEDQPKAEHQPPNCAAQGSAFIVYQAFSFIAWTEATVEPIILICFDRNLNLLARFLYCDRDHYTAAQLAFLMAQSRDTQAASHHQHHHGHSFPPPPPPPPHAGQNHLLQHHHHQTPNNHRHLQASGDEERDPYGDNGLGACVMAADDTEEAMALQNSIELGGEAFHESRGARRYRQGGDMLGNLSDLGDLGDLAAGIDSTLGRGRSGRSASPRRLNTTNTATTGLLPAPPAPPCRHCSPIMHAGGESGAAPYKPTARYASGNDSSSGATRELRGLMMPDTPESHAQDSFEMRFSPLPLRVDCENDPLGYKSSRANRRNHGGEEEGDVAF
ncbi:hypothetical protein EGW08_013092 [Elysia chlorotica]|uniref:Uncharacterized protein n=1 Tax=Elysia chlorotica TaxID=188477 RepID=A0A3S0ZHQ2_ELYCH|nr:hypothetical protein EGW08_013092 [Elysia chlorotica]